MAKKPVKATAKKKSFRKVALDPRMVELAEDIIDSIDSDLPVEPPLIKTFEVRLANGELIALYGHYLQTLGDGALSLWEYQAYPWHYQDASLTWIAAAGQWHSAREMVADHGSVQ